MEHSNETANETSGMIVYSICRLDDVLPQVKDVLPRQTFKDAWQQLFQPAGSGAASSWHTPVSFCEIVCGAPLSMEGVSYRYFLA